MKVNKLSLPLPPGVSNVISLDHECKAKQREAIIRQWSALFAADTRGRALQHPDVAITIANSRSRPIWVYAERNDASEEQITSLAIFEARPLVIRPLRIFTKFQHQIPVLKLVGTSLLGEESTQHCEQMLISLNTHLQSSRGGAKAVYFEEVDADTSLGRAIARFRRTSKRRNVVEWALTQKHWYLQFPESPEDYWCKFSTKRLNQFRREKRKCEAELQVVTRPDQVAAFLEAAETVSMRSWQGSTFGLRVSNDESTVGVWRRIAELGMLRSYLLVRKNVPVAFMFGTIHGECYTGEEMAYDRTVSKISAGKVLLLEMIGDLMTVPCVKRIDFGYGDAWYKEHFCTDSGNIASWLMLGPSATTAALVHLKWTYAKFSQALRKWQHGRAQQ